MKTKIFSYNQLNTPIHNMSGSTKFLCFLMMTFSVMLSYDIRVILCVMLFSFYTLWISKIKLKQIKAMLIYTVVLLLFNYIISYIFAPEWGVKIYGTRHEITHFFWNYSLTQEQLLYQTTKFMKYFSVIPLGMIFLLTTNPSELASSLNATGINYKAAYCVSLTLRYFPDIIRDYNNISQSQQARGLDMSKKEKLSKRIKSFMTIIIPLIFSALDRIETISNAMDLRGFGKNKKRTWYSKKTLKKLDFAALALCTMIFLATLSVSIFINHSRFYNPFK